ncbi:holo-ACP synthase [Clostridium paraputrificum]|uniref:holo-ACP synthase n=1 Tax=Clostridium paraputrificum TaxID=29363 RepID=UPI003F5EED31
MIRGVGTDIVQVGRIGTAIKRTPMFLEKVFTEEERKYFKSRNNNLETIAGNFAAKEAISKAMGTGIRGFGLLDIEILRSEMGQPIVNISDKVKEVISIKEDYSIHVSISHTNENAIAFAIWEEMT